MERTTLQNRSQISGLPFCSQRIKENIWYSIPCMQVLVFKSLLTTRHQPNSSITLCFSPMWKKVLECFLSLLSLKLLIPSPLLHNDGLQTGSCSRYFSAPLLYVLAVGKTKIVVQRSLTVRVLVQAGSTFSMYLLTSPQTDYIVM